MIEFNNPYTAGDPVGKTNLFVGREDVLHEVERLLRHPSQNAITLYGQRRIGKTSILQYLESHLHESGKYQPVYFDLMHKAGLPLEKILNDLARTISLKLNLAHVNSENITEKSFRESYLPKALDTLSDNVGLVLLLDEFDVLADPDAEQHTKREFFSYLRDLRQLDPVRLQFVFVLGRNIDDLDVIAQGLFKDLPSRRVSLLDEKNTDALVRLSEQQGSLFWTPEAVTRIWELASGHPYLTQALCSQVWENAYDESLEREPRVASDVENAVADALERSQNMFVWLWEGLGPAEKVVAAALAGVGQTVVDENQLADILASSGVRILIGELQNAPKILAKWDILVPVSGGHIFRVELLRRWIAENKPLDRTQDELDQINPVANSFFSAANGLYQRKNFEQAETALRQALGINPNHLRANELLAEILLSQGNRDEAQQILEYLETIAPGKGRRRLVQIYSDRARASKSSTGKLEWYEKILVIAPGDRSALEARNQIYHAQGEKALEKSDFQAAMKAFEQSGDTNLYNKAAEALQQQNIAIGLEKIAQMENEKAYQDAFSFVQELATQFPGARNWKPDIDRLQTNIRLDEKYKQALGALQQGDRSQAKKLLAEVISINPDYEQASRYLHLVVTGDDPQKIKEELELAKSEPKKQETKAKNDKVVPAAQAPSPKEDAATVEPKSVAKEKTHRQISKWNPLENLQLFIWILVKPALLQEYLTIYGENARKLVSSRLIYSMTLIPLVAPVLALGLGLAPASSVPWQPITYLWGAAGMLAILLVLMQSTEFSLEMNDFIVGLLGGFIAAMVYQSTGSMLAGMVYIALVCMMAGIASFFNTDPLHADDARTALISGVVASFVLFAIITLVGGVFGTLLNSVSGALVNWLAGKMTGVLAYIVSVVFAILAILVSLIIAFGGIVLGAYAVGIIAYVSELVISSSVRSAVKSQKASPFILVVLLAAWLAVVIFSFGGVTWLRTGTWPIPVLPF